MLYPILPIFLTATLKVPVTVLGLIEGVAESTASILKAFSGWFSDRIQRRKPLLVAGYSCSAFSKFLLVLACSWPLVFFARFVDRFGKGIRTSARDALIAESTSAETRGKAFGLHRGLDTLGAVLGPLITILLLKSVNDNLRIIFYIAVIPAVIGILLLILFVRDKKIEGDKTGFSLNLLWRECSPSFKGFLFVSFIFGLGNSSDAFLILRAKGLGLTTSLVVFAYILFNLGYAFFSLPAGIVADRIGPRKVLLGGFFLFALVYLAFGLVRQTCYLWFLFPLYGVYMALTEGVGKAYISNLVPAERLGTMMGFYQTAVGVSVLFASLLAGLLWSHIGAGAPFIYGSVMALSAGLLFAGVKHEIPLNPPFAKGEKGD